MRPRLLVAAALLAGGRAIAQDAAPPAELPPLEVTPGALPASPERLPASVTQVERDALAGAQYQVNLSESLVRVPGLTINDRHNYAQDLQLSLRGFGARAAFGVRGLRLYTDGIPATMPDGQGQVSHFDLASTERVTVLRGPFSALYGASSGGVIELTSTAPRESSATLSGWGASHESTRAGVTGAFAGDAWSLAGSGSRFDTEGSRQHSAATRSGGQARLALAPGRSELVLIANGLDLFAQDPLGLTRAQWEADPAQAGVNALAYDTRKTVRQSQLGAAWTAPLGGQALRAVAWGGTRQTRQFQSIPDTVQGTLADNPTHPGGMIDLERAYYGTDLRWLARAGAAQLALGLDLEFLDERRQGFQNFTGTPGPASVKGVQGPQRRDEDNAATSADPYAQAEWALGARWSALAGLRMANVRFRSEDRFIVAGNGDDSGVVDFEAFLPVAGLRYADQGFAWHVAASRGAETPTLNELAYRPDGSAGLNTALRESRSTHYELGSRVTRGALAAELALFRIDTRDEIVVAASSGGRTSFRNAARTERHGLELGSRWHVAPALALLGSYTWLDARYRDYVDGNRLPGVPRHTLFAELAWTPAAPGTLLALEGLHRSPLAVDDANSDAAPESSVFNLRAQHRLGAVTLFARVDNIFDRDTVGSVIVNESNGRYFEPAPGRGFALGVTLTP